MREYARLATALSLFVGLAAVLVSCSDGENSQPAGAASTKGTGSTSRNAERAAYQPVRFRAGDGIELVGRLWGDGDVAVVLAHGFSEGVAQDGWLSFARVLAERDYLVLTFNFRGFCDSEACSEAPNELEKNWRDVIAALAFLEERNARKAFLVGASMGGLAVLRAARMPGADVAGVVSLSTPQFPSRYYVGEPQANDVTPARLRQIDEPKLFVAGKDDVQLPGSAPLRTGVESVRFAADARRMFQAAGEPKQLALLDSASHSSELVTQAEDDVVKETRRRVLRFLRAHS
ncbi:MAG: alpha/beta fold hydrolase [Actinomycetota bacterium]|nr:alpha/beta fold hydrolase [Actinomycetota bacterium]